MPDPVIRSRIGVLRWQKYSSDSEPIKKSVNAEERAHFQKNKDLISTVRTVLALTDPVYRMSFLRHGKSANQAAGRSVCN
jgi:hypothetical protein